MAKPKTEPRRTKTYSVTDSNILWLKEEGKRLGIGASGLLNMLVEIDRKAKEEPKK